MKLYYAETLMPRLACAVARYVAAPMEYVWVDLFKNQQASPAFLALNPNGKVPVLEEGELRLWEADAIACYLARRFRPELWPESQVHEVVRWLSWNARHFTREGSVLYFERVIKPYIGKEANDRAIAAAETEFARHAAVLEHQLTGAPFVLGGEISVADFALATALPWTKEAGLPLDDCPAIRAWYSRIEELEAWRSPYPKR